MSKEIALSDRDCEFPKNARSSFFYIQLTANRWLIRLVNALVFALGGFKLIHEYMHNRGNVYSGGAIKTPHKIRRGIHKRFINVRKSEMWMSKYDAPISRKKRRQGRSSTIFDNRVKRNFEYNLTTPA